MNRRVLLERIVSRSELTAFRVQAVVDRDGQLQIDVRLVRRATPTTPFEATGAGFVVEPRLCRDVSDAFRAAWTRVVEHETWKP